MDRGGWRRLFRIVVRVRAELMGRDCDHQQGKKDEQGHVEVCPNRESELIHANLNLTLTGINEKKNGSKARFCYCNDKNRYLSAYVYVYYFIFPPSLLRSIN